MDSNSESASTRVAASHSSRQEHLLNLAVRPSHHSSTTRLADIRRPAAAVHDTRPHPPRQKPAAASTARNPPEDYPNCQFFFAPLSRSHSPPLVSTAFFLIPGSRSGSDGGEHLQRAVRQRPRRAGISAITESRQAAGTFHAHTSSNLLLTL